MGWLLVIWGVNKIVNVEHSVAVANHYYFGFLAMEAALPIAGIFQVLIGLLVVIGLARRWVYPIQLLFNGGSLVAVLPSVIDPWGWIFEGSNVFFYPSLIIFASAILLIVFRDQDQLAWDARRQARRNRRKTWTASRCSH
ncbi:hypothetical protein GCM10007160_11840 [Litchfieldella qijiaojingensis]|uniref:Uncharacterized protein n=2 Tax=Litchfieldella qijiaojingensis TaxID=980347 RepID=A0ABQ2YJG4_9GAMM|nr:hypothetical protein GCM10007160_11840 [Halomonas qijiaojingensis]